MATALEESAELTCEDAGQHIIEALRGLRFGALELQVHDGRIVRITRTEKVRIQCDGADGKGTRKTK